MRSNRSASSAPLRKQDLRLESVLTKVVLPEPPEAVWSRLMFYEQIPENPPLLLRLLLPVPEGVEGRKSQVGDITRCRYRDGHLLKQVKSVERNRRYDFEVVEQSLRVRGGIRLQGGCYALRALPQGGTEVALRTRYATPGHPRWLWKPIEAAVCHVFHRHILSALGRAVSPRPRLDAVAVIPGRGDAAREAPRVLRFQGP